MPSIQRMTTSYQKDQQKYCKIAEFENDTTGISMLISVFKNHENSSPSVVLLTGYSDGLSVNSIKRGTYLTNVYYQKKENKTIVYVKSSAYVYISTLCIGTNGGLNLSHENNLDLPSGAIEIPISWQEFSNIWELEELLQNAYDSYSLKESIETEIGVGLGVYYITQPNLASLSCIVIINYDNYQVLGMKGNLSFSVSLLKLTVVSKVGDIDINVRKILKQ